MVDSNVILVLMCNVCFVKEKLLLSKSAIRMQSLSYLPSYGGTSLSRITKIETKSKDLSGTANYLE